MIIYYTCYRGVPVIGKRDERGRETYKAICRRGYRGEDISKTYPTLSEALDFVDEIKGDRIYTNPDILTYDARRGGATYRILFSEDFKEVYLRRQ